MSFFGLFKSKPKLAELIPEGFVDIHSHFLPGIDDGSTAVKESIDMLSSSKKLGMKKFIFTPHIYKDVYNNTEETISSAFNKLTQSSQFDKDLSVKYAAEYYLNDFFIDLVKKKEVLCLKDNLVLIELSFLNAPIQLKEYLYEIQINGYSPVLAHPERYIHCNNLVKYEQLKLMGLKFQLNLNSCVGFYGKEVAEKSELLLKSELIDFVGTDFHRMEYINAFENNLQINSIEKLERAIKGNSIFNF